MPKSTTPFWIAAFVLGSGVDILFWGKPVGISFFIWAALALSSACFLTLKAGSHPARANILLGVIILGLAAQPFLRAEPFSRGLGVLLALIGLMIWAATLRNGNWLHFTVWDYIRAVAVLVFAALTRPFQQPKPAENHPASGSYSVRLQQGRAVLRGLLLALPIVGVLALLLASADLVFAQRIETVLQALRLDRLPETLFRLFYIGVLTVIFCGVLLHAVLPRQEIRPSEREAPFLSPFLGWTESSIVLGSVNALFAFFVVLQFRYLFGGQVNIHEAGFTYAEYARRGFGELVWVALISLGLVLALHTIARRETPRRQRSFILLNGLLIGLVLVILASALQRLILYEQAYGFTRLRTYTYLFIPWLGLLLLTVVGLLFTSQMRRVGLVLLIFGLGYGLLLGFWNVDGWIARQNIQRAMNGQDLDGDYLQTLSADAVPELIRQVNQAGLPASAQQEILIGLACRAAQSTPTHQPWQSFNLSQNRAENLLDEHADLWQMYLVEVDSYGRYILVEGERRYCGYAERWD
jgi:hypothetical protein